MYGLVTIARPSKALTLNAVENDVNLATKFGNPTYPLNAIAKITANKGSTGSNPSVRTGTTWKAGTILIVINQASLTGATGTTGSPGSAGNNGSGGAGGRGGQSFPNIAGAAGSSGGAGTSGSPGGPGGNGAPGFQADAVSGVKILVDNGAGTISGGPAGPGGPGGTKGAGGGGGGGGGGAQIP